MCSDKAGTALLTLTAYRENIVNAYNIVEKNLGSVAEIIKDVELLSALTSLFFQWELDLGSIYNCFFISSMWTQRLNNLLDIFFSAMKFFS